MFYLNDCVTKLSSITPNHSTSLKPNRLEAELLSGVKIRQPEDIAKAADKLLEMGIHRVFISLGSDGVYAFGPGAEHFTGLYENTDIFHKIATLLNLKK